MRLSNFLSTLSAAALAAGALALGASAMPGEFDERAEKLLAVEEWPSAEGTHFVDRYARDPTAVPWMIAALGSRTFGIGEVTESRRAVLVATLRKMPWQAVHDPIHESAAPGTDEDGTANGVWLLGELGDATEVEHVVELVASVGEGAGRELLGTLEQALASLLARDPAAVHRVRELFDERYQGLWPHVAAGVGRSGQVAALGQLAHLLNRHADLDALLLTQMGVLGALASPPAEWDVCWSVRDFLTDDRPGVRREAALALGKLRDSDSVDVLLGLLEDPNRGVRANALWALREICGLNLGESPERWRHWYGEELGWWNETYPDLLEAIRRGETAEVSDAISALSLKRLFRHQMAEDLSMLVSHPAPEVRWRACVALRELGSLAASRELVGALQDSDENVRREALAALCATSGRDLPPDTVVWQQALGLDR